MWLMRERGEEENSRSFTRPSAVLPTTIVRTINACVLFWLKTLAQAFSNYRTNLYSHSIRESSTNENKSARGLELQKQILRAPIQATNDLNNNINKGNERTRLKYLVSNIYGVLGRGEGGTSLYILVDFPKHVFSNSG